MVTGAFSELTGHCYFGVCVCVRRRVSACVCVCDYGYALGDQPCELIG